MKDDNVCYECGLPVEDDDKNYYFKDMLPSVWYTSDRRHIKFGKPKKG